MRMRFNRAVTSKIIFEVVFTSPKNSKIFNRNNVCPLRSRYNRVLAGRPSPPGGIRSRSGPQGLHSGRRSRRQCRGARRGEEVGGEAAGGAHRAQDLPAGRARRDGVRGADGRRAYPDQPGADRMPVAQADRGGPGDAGVHHALHRRPEAEVHAEQRAAAVRHFVPDWRVRLRRQAAPVPDGAVGHLLRVEGERDGKVGEDCARVLGEVLYGGGGGDGEGHGEAGDSGAFGGGAVGPEEFGDCVDAEWGVDGYVG